VSTPTTGPVKPGGVVQADAVDAGPVAEPTTTPKQTRVDASRVDEKMSPLDE